MPAIRRHFGDAARVAQVRLQDRRGLLLQHFAEAPLGEDALAGGDGQMRAARDLGHEVVVLALHRLFDEHRLIRLQRLDQQLRRGRADRSVKIDADIDESSPSRSRSLGESFGRVVRLRPAFRRSARAAAWQAGLERREALA